MRAGVNQAQALPLWAYILSGILGVILAVLAADNGMLILGLAFIFALFGALAGINALLAARRAGTGLEDFSVPSACIERALARRHRSALFAASALTIALCFAVAAAISLSLRSLWLAHVVVTPLLAYAAYHLIWIGTAARRSEAAIASGLPVTFSPAVPLPNQIRRVADGRESTRAALRSLPLLGVDGRTAREIANMVGNPQAPRPVALPRPFSVLGPEIGRRLRTGVAGSVLWLPFALITLAMTWALPQSAIPRLPTPSAFFDLLASVAEEDAGLVAEQEVIGAAPEENSEEAAEGTTDTNPDNTESEGSAATDIGASGADGEETSAGESAGVPDNGAAPDPSATGGETDGQPEGPTNVASPEAGAEAQNASGATGREPAENGGAVTDEGASSGSETDTPEDAAHDAPDEDATGAAEPGETATETLTDTPGGGGPGTQGAGSAEGETGTPDTGATGAEPGGTEPGDTHPASDAGAEPAEGGNADAVEDATGAPDTVSTGTDPGGGLADGGEDTTGTPDTDTSSVDPGSTDNGATDTPTAPGTESAETGNTDAVADATGTPDSGTPGAEAGGDPTSGDNTDAEDDATGISDTDRSGTEPDGTDNGAADTPTEQGRRQTESGASGPAGADAEPSGDGTAAGGAPSEGNGSSGDQSAPQSPNDTSLGDATTDPAQPAATADGTLPQDATDRRGSDGSQVLPGRSPLGEVPLPSGSEGAAGDLPINGTGTADPVEAASGNAQAAEIDLDGTPSETGDEIEVQVGSAGGAGTGETGAPVTMLPTFTGDPPLDTDPDVTAQVLATPTETQDPTGLDALNAEIAEVSARTDSVAPLGVGGLPQGNRQQFAAPGTIGETVILPPDRPVALSPVPGPPPTQPLPAWILDLTGGQE